MCLQVQAGGITKSAPHRSAPLISVKLRQRFPALLWKPAHFSAGHKSLLCSAGNSSLSLETGGLSFFSSQAAQMLPEALYNAGKQRVPFYSGATLCSTAFLAVSALSEYLLPGLLPLGAFFHWEDKGLHLSGKLFPWIPLPDKARFLVSVSTAQVLKSLRLDASPHSQGEGALQPISYWSPS